MIGAIDIRWSTRQDAAALAEVHNAAWRYAYAGIIPGIDLERSITRHGRGWWERRLSGSARYLILSFDGEIVGYAGFGPSPIYSKPPLGEIYELYLKPEYHGTGLGKALFREARAHLRSYGFKQLIIWSLKENENGCRFYEALGGKAKLRATEPFGATRLEKIGYVWG